MKAEFYALIHNNTWTLVPFPLKRQTIRCKWMFRLKENPDGTINKYKDMLVAKGLHQRYGFDFTRTFSNVVKPITLQSSCPYPLPISGHKQLDVNNSSLNGFLHDEVYMEHPKGFESFNPSLV